MHFLPFFSTILATAVLVASEPSDQYNSFDIASADLGTLPTDISYDGDLAGKPPSPSSAGDTTAPGQQPAPHPGPGQPQQIPSQEINPVTQQQQPPSPGEIPNGPQQVSPPTASPYGQQQVSPPAASPYGQQREQSPLPAGSTSPPSGYQGDQHCRQFGGCPFECHEDCVCWEWCKGAQCNLAPFGEQALTPAQISCDPSAGEKFIGKVCRPYCANWCEDIKNQIVQALTSEQEQRAFLSKPLECDKNYYNCPSGPNPSGLDCLTPNNPLAPPGSGSPSGYGSQQQPTQTPNFGAPPSPSSNYKELDKSEAKDTTEFSLDDSWRK